MRIKYSGEIRQTGKMFWAQLDGKRGLFTVYGLWVNY